MNVMDWLQIPANVSLSQMCTVAPLLRIIAFGIRTGNLAVTLAKIRINSAMLHSH